LLEGKHFWRVQASNSYGPSAWSERRILWTGDQIIDVGVAVAIFLEGPFTGSEMAVSNLFKDERPLEQPYDSALYGASHLAYAGSESVVEFPETSIDWVLLSLRTTTDQASEVARLAAIVLEDGTVVSPDSTTPVFPDIPADEYYVVVSHRNHMSVMSATEIDLSTGTGSHDFTTGSGQAYSGGGDAMKELTAGVYGMFAADGDFDGVATAPDFNLWNTATSAGNTGYDQADYDLDGNVTAPDFNIWNASTTMGAASQVPE